MPTRDMLWNTPMQNKPQRKAVFLHEKQRIFTDENVELINLEFLGRSGNGAVHRMIVRIGALRGLIVAVKFLEAIDDQQRVSRFKFFVSNKKNFVFSRIWNKNSFR